MEGKPKIYKLNQSLCRLKQTLRVSGVWGSQNLLKKRYMKVALLSALCFGRLYHKQIPLILISVRGWGRTQGHSAAESLNSIKNLGEPTGNWTCCLPTFSAARQSTGPPTQNPKRPLFSMFSAQNMRSPPCLSSFYVSYFIHIMKLFAGTRQNVEALAKAPVEIKVDRKWKHAIWIITSEK